MSLFDPLQIIGDSATQAVDQSKTPLPFSSSSSINQATNLLGSAQNIANTALVEIGDRAFSIQQKLFPAKKQLTFLLRNKDGLLSSPPAGSGFNPGFAFTMAINPSSLVITYPAKTVNAIRTMGGWVLQHWFPEMGTITAEGTIGNLLQRWNTDTKMSPRWANFEKLIGIYQNNSIAYQPGVVNRNLASFNPTVELAYDYVTYRGYFETFTFTEEEGQPYTRKYSWSFKFLEMTDTRKITELSAFTSQASQITSKVNSVINSTTGALSAL